MSNLCHKTRVYKFKNFWWVDYNIPYAGPSLLSCVTWEEAIKTAYAVEENRIWA